MKVLLRIRTGRFMAHADRSFGGIQKAKVWRRF